MSDVIKVIAAEIVLGLFSWYSNHLSTKEHNSFTPINVDFDKILIIENIDSKRNKCILQGYTKKKKKKKIILK